MRRLQSILIEHQAKQAAKAASSLARKMSREQVSCANRNQGVADPSQVVARRKEFGVAMRQRIPETGQVELVVDATPQPVGTSDKQVSWRNRPVLTLKRA
jgi:hypothetical protein